MPDRENHARIAASTEHALGVEGPVRESYLASVFDTADAGAWQTEIAWPIFRTSA